ncbi:interleukin-15 receptor subunit alpha isoform X3 [Notothenia coriiceps]|uniref:Interleukin-15 receptor subunit alpha isoform X3 n=1 Tax=Notothenia coriiceps TaxID=8208 RepID=A0A6I9NSV0_9TELE|nr:PREDICTED: interleukin-15 receptor subunit alpha-like isoform X3 [Notothenia coriiceps]
MELDSSSLTCLAVLCLLGAAEISSIENNTCCPDIPQANNTKPPEVPCFQINSKFRYKCIYGYVRKSGTSNLLKCNGTAFIYTPSTKEKFECILNPNNITAPPKSTATTSRSLQTSQSIQPSAPLSAETTSSSTFSSLAPPGSSQGAVDSMPGTEASKSHGTLSTTTEASNNGTIIPGMLSSSAPRIVIGCVSLVIFCALVGISFFFYKRRSKNEIPHRTDEQIPMKMDPRD